MSVMRRTLAITETRAMRIKNRPSSFPSRGSSARFAASSSTTSSTPTDDDAVSSKYEKTETSSSSSFSTSSTVPCDDDDKDEYDNKRKSKLKSDIYAHAATTSRGKEATSMEKENVKKLLRELKDLQSRSEKKNEVKMSANEMLNGKWQLCYTDTHSFRSSPFFWQLGNALGEDNAKMFYSAHEHQTSLFGGVVGQCFQTIDLEAKTLTSDCVVKASVGVPFVGISPIFSGYGSVISKANIVDSESDSLFVVMESTTIKQDDENVIPFLNFLNNTRVPVYDVFQSIGNAVPPVEMKICYVDEEMRVTELGDGSVFVYKRV